MARSLSGIYGADDNAFAQRVSSDALTSSGQGPEDYWGEIQDSRSMAKGNVGAESLGPSDPDTPTLTGYKAGGGDKERGMVGKYPQMSRFPRHVPGPKTATDEGGGVKQPPPRNQLATRKGGSPKP